MNDVNMKRVAIRIFGQDRAQNRIEQDENIVLIE